MKVQIPLELPQGWKRENNAFMELLGAHPDECPTFSSSCGLFVTITQGVEQDKHIWIHVSISRKKREPSYYDLCDVKKIFLGENAMAYLLFPPTREHVNIHPHCLHLWSCPDARITPDFTRGTGSI